MDFQDGPEHAALRAAVAQIAGDFGSRYYAQKAEAAEPTSELWQALAAGGYVGINIPAEYGGGGAGRSELAIVCEESAAQGCPLLLLLVSSAICGEVISRYGSPEQRKDWLPPLASGQDKIVFAITEPDAGSNSRRLSTTATAAGGGDWLLAGTKYYISGVDDARAILVVARTGTDEATGHARLSLFLVDTDAPGLSRQLLPVSARLPERQFTLYFDQVRVGADRLVGKPGDGFGQVFHGLNPERITGAALCVGVGRHALDRAAQYARTRTVWNAPVGAHQGLAHPLAQTKIEIELAGLMTAKAGWLHDQRQPAGDAANMAKYAAAEAALAAVDAAIQTHGGNGLSREYGLLPLWELARLLRIAPVSREMILNHVAQHQLGLPRSYLTAAGTARPTAGPSRQVTALTGGTDRTHDRGSQMDTDLHASLIQRVNVGDSLTRTAARHPDRVAVVDSDRRWSYRALNDWVNLVAGGLASLGYRRGDALALASGNSAEFLAIYYACAKLGVICVPVNLGWRTDEVAYVLGHSGARGLVVESQLAEAMTPALQEGDAVTIVIVAPGTGSIGTPGRGPGGPATGGASAGAEGGRHWLSFADLAAAGTTAEPQCLVADRDPVTYLYTSGTTSAPKGVIGNHTAIYLESLTMALEARFDADDRFAALLPMFHTAQLNCHCTPAIMVGATIHVLRGFDPGGLLKRIETERITQIFGLPMMMYRDLLDHPDIGRRDLSSLRRACYAMAPMPDAQLRRCLETFGCDFYLLFGQTEMSPTVTMFRPEHQLSHAGAVGAPVVNIEVGIMDPGGTLLPPGEQGEIVYRGPHTMSGYLKDPAATEAAFAHGWFHSGDVGRVDEDGILWFSDRRKDVIKTGGENVASIEVEKAVYAADLRVAEVVVVGLPHDHWGEAITAVVVPKPGAAPDEGELMEEVRRHLDGYKAPKSVIFVDELPRTSTGKIRKNLVRETYSGHYAGS